MSNLEARPLCACGCGVRIQRGTDLVEYGELHAGGVVLNGENPYRHGCAMRILREKFRGVPWVIAARRKCFLRAGEAKQARKSDKRKAAKRAKGDLIAEGPVDGGGERPAAAARQSRGAAGGAGRRAKLPNESVIGRVPGGHPGI